MAKSTKIFVLLYYIVAAIGLVILADLGPTPSSSNRSPLFLGVKEELILLATTVMPAPGPVLAYTEGGVPGWLESLLRAKFCGSLGEPHLITSHPVSSNLSGSNVCPSEPCVMHCPQGT